MNENEKPGHLAGVHTIFRGRREEVRRELALLLLVILALIVASSLLIVAFSPSATTGPASSASTDTLLRLLEIIFAPVVGLVGSALGFYYGSKK